MTDLALWTTQAVENALESFFEQVEEDELEGPDGWNALKWGDGVPCEVPGLGTLNYVADYGGEGMGNEYWVVFSLTKGDVTKYFKKEGSYSSYGGDGGLFDADLEPVNPKAKVIIVWE